MQSPISRHFTVSVVDSIKLGPDCSPIPIFRELWLSFDMLWVQ